MGKRGFTYVRRFPDTILLEQAILSAELSSSQLPITLKYPFSDHDIGRHQAQKGYSTYNPRLMLHRSNIEILCILMKNYADRSLHFHIAAMQHKG